MVGKKYYWNLVFYFWGVNLVRKVFNTGMQFFLGEVIRPAYCKRGYNLF
ncbi:hypothetical protein A33Q_0431 [Indibacter alkaliphilus LW1]|uniref:Uncharacterized protein n=1 Tax=Indibacter alkaliphilus (strain CCUG 57479 / KCTC 22604 / LW1) TaxID=1189612 RepID=S2DR48_INDAL|nr:hypothetical protein A33Q_0431 [Indibacter alkaliphilus LW1]